MRIDRKVISTWQEALSDFILSRQAMGLSPRTINDYQQHVKLFFSRYPDAWNPSNLKRAVMMHMSHPVAPATFNNRRKYLKIFFNWCMEEGIFPENPLSRVPKKRDEGRIRDIKAEVLERLMSLPNKKTYTGLRDYALILLSLDIGIRPREALSLLVSDVDLEGKTVTIRREISKTRKTSILPITEPVVNALKKLVHVRHPVWDKDAPLFCTRDGTPLTVRRWEARLKKYSDILGTSVTPYDLRHGFATLFLRDGGNVYALQKILRHSSMDMVRRYLQFNDEDIRRQHELASPVVRLLTKTPRVGKI